MSTILINGKPVHYYNNVLMRGKSGYGPLYILHSGYLRKLSTSDEDQFLFTFMYCYHLYAFTCDTCKIDQLQFFPRGNFRQYFVHHGCTCGLPGYDVDIL